MTFRDQLERLGLSQRAYAQMAQLNPRSVRRWANGYRDPPEAIMVTLEASTPSRICLPD
jgi:DNA-binding transcriptional regulator YiaG